MEPLETQEQFEATIWRPEKPTNTLYFVYFTANWCSACKRLNLEDIVRTNAHNPLVKYYKCDVDENDYTGPFCGVKSLPTFVAFHAGTVVDKLANSNTDVVISWLADVQNMLKVKKN